MWRAGRHESCHTRDRSNLDYLVLQYFEVSVHSSRTFRSGNELAFCRRPIDR